MTIENNKEKQMHKSISVEFVQVPATWELPLLERQNLLSTVDWVKFGRDNKFPSKVMEAYQKAGLNQAIINKKLNMMLGEGLTWETDKPAQEKRMEKWMMNPNPYENMESLVNKLLLDYVIFGGCYVQVIWNRGGKAIAELYHTPFDRVRSGKKNRKGIVDEYFYLDETKDWVNANAFSDVSGLPAFNTETKKGKPQILPLNSYSPLNPYYPMPDYSAALVDIDTYINISIFHSANIRNNFAPGMLIFFRGPEPSQDEKDDIVTQLKKKYSGAENAGKPAIFFLDSEQEEPTIEVSGNSENANMFESLSKSIRENIVTSHQIPGALAAIPEPGSLGNSKEILQSEMMFMQDYIKPLQEKFLNMFNVIQNVNKLPDIEFINPNPSIIMYDINELESVLTQEEIREFLGYEPLEKKVVEPEEDEKEIIDSEADTEKENIS